MKRQSAHGMKTINDQEHRKNDSISLVIKEMQLKAIIIFHYLPIMF